MRADSYASFHKLYRRSKPRVVYYKQDFIDYFLMIAMTAIAIAVSYGWSSVMSFIGIALCGVMIATFIIRHGIEFKMPVILSRPQEILYTLTYKLQNLNRVYFTALGLLLLENLLIAATPNLPHHAELMRKVALYFFYIHIISVTAFRVMFISFLSSFRVYGIEAGRVFS